MGQCPSVLSNSALANVLFTNDISQKWGGTDHPLLPWSANVSIFKTPLRPLSANVSICLNPLLLHCQLVTLIPYHHYLYQQTNTKKNTIIGIN